MSDSGLSSFICFWSTYWTLVFCRIDGWLPPDFRRPQPDTVAVLKNKYSCLSQKKMAQHLLKFKLLNLNTVINEMCNRVGRFFMVKLFWMRVLLEYIHFYVKVPKKAKTIWGHCSFRERSHPFIKAPNIDQKKFFRIQSCRTSKDAEFNLPCWQNVHIKR
jgi:hypothetical protein